MLKYFTIVCFFIPNSISAQSTYTNLYDIETGILDVPKDLELVNNEIIVAAQHFCDQDTIVISCTSLSKFNLSGDLIQTISLDTLFPEGHNRLFPSENTIYLSGHRQHLFEDTPTTLLQFNHSFELLSYHDIPSLAVELPNNDGIISDEEYIYVYGRVWVEENNRHYGQIQKIEKESKQLIWDKRYERGLWLNDCFDLQFTPSGNLAFINNFVDGVGAGGEFGYQIVEIDTSGEVFNSYEFEDIDDVPVKLLVSQTTGYYFSSDLEPLGSLLTSSHGRINKLSSDMSELEWSLKLPYDPFINARDYNVTDYIETSNGDIVACGSVWDATDNSEYANNTWNGFIVRLNPEGKIIWLRVYRYSSQVLPVSEYGKYRPSFLNKIRETETGGFIAAGQATYKNNQSQGLEEGEARGETWLLSVNENGCLAGEECRELIVLDGQNTNQMAFNIGTIWTYETTTQSLPYIIDYETFEIVDTVRIQDTLAFVIESSRPALFPTEYMYEEEGKIYFWDQNLEQFQLNFDFNTVMPYTTPWSGQCHEQEDIAIVNIDSVGQQIIDLDTFEIQHLRIENNGSFGNDMHSLVYKNIGVDDGIKLQLGYGLCDPQIRITKLRCFENDSIQVNFVNYPCDTTFYLTATSEIADLRDIEVYPNPSNGQINIKGFNQNVDYWMYNIAGELVQQGQTFNQSLFFDQVGIYFLKFRCRGLWSVKKVVIVK